MGHSPARKKIRLPSHLYLEGHAFFITIRTYRQYPWFSLYADFANYAVSLLNEASTTRDTMLYAWCVMPNHLHLLLQDNDVLNFVRLFKGRMTPLAFNKEPVRKLWQRSFFDHAMRKEETLHEKALYIWENPVRAGIVDNPVKYEWSGSAIWPNWKEFYGRG